MNNTAEIKIPDLTQALSQINLTAPSDIFIIINDVDSEHNVPTDMLLSYQSKTYNIKIKIDWYEKPVKISLETRRTTAVRHAADIHITITDENNEIICDKTEMDADSYTIKCKTAKIIAEYTNHNDKPVGTHEPAFYFILSEKIKGKKDVDIDKMQDYLTTPYFSTCYNISDKKKILKTNHYTIVPYQNGEGIAVCNVQRTHTTEFKDNKFQTKYTDEMQAYASMVPGKQSNAYRKVRNDYTKCDIWDVLKLTAANLKYQPIDYHVGSILDYITQNAPTFAERSKFVDFLTTCNGEETHCTLAAKFTTFMLILWYAPQAELLLSMGNFHIIKTIDKNIAKATNREDAKSAINEIQPLFDENATEGNKILIMPKHISEHLTKKEASFELYKAYSDLTKMLPVIKDKNKFNEFIRHPLMLQLALQSRESQLTVKLFDMFKYGYTSYTKLFNYIVKQTLNYDNDMCYVSRTIDTMSDYLYMCDILDITIDLYPQDLDKAHQTLSEMKQVKASKDTEMFVKNLAERCEKATESVKSDDYTAVFATRVDDFVNEGQQMHNCVGRYYRKVLENKCILFFIRRKSNPTQSYITAEYLIKSKKLGAIYAERNTPVLDSAALVFAEKIVDKLKTMDKTTPAK